MWVESSLFPSLYFSVTLLLCLNWIAFIQLVTAGRKGSWEFSWVALCSSWTFCQANKRCTWGLCIKWSCCKRKLTFLSLSLSSDPVAVLAVSGRITGIHSCFNCQVLVVSIAAKRIHPPRLWVFVFVCPPLLSLFLFSFFIRNHEWNYESQSRVYQFRKNHSHSPEHKSLFVLSSSSSLPFSLRPSCSFFLFVRVWAHWRKRIALNHYRSCVPSWRDHLNRHIIKWSEDSIARDFYKHLHALLMHRLHRAEQSHLRPSLFVFSFCLFSCEYFALWFVLHRNSHNCWGNGSVPWLMVPGSTRRRNLWPPHGPLRGKVFHRQLPHCLAK